jgi:hypothetical protein
MVLEMIASPIAGWLSGIAAPLTQMFGDALTVSRNGNMVCWGYDGQSAVIEMTLDGLLCATFIDCERLEAVSALPAVRAMMPILVRTGLRIDVMIGSRRVLHGGSGVKQNGLARMLRLPSVHLGA